MAKQAQPARRQFPPTADQVDGCPPHHWMVNYQTQTCRKCGEERAAPAPEQRTGWR